MKVEVHHIIPLQWVHKMGKGFNPNNLKNLVGFEKTIHSKITAEWGEFAKKYSDPTAKQIQQFADYIMDKYRDYQIK